MLPYLCCQQWYTEIQQSCFHIQILYLGLCINIVHCYINRYDHIKYIRSHNIAFHLLREMSCFYLHFAQLYFIRKWIQEKRLNRLHDNKKDDTYWPSHQRLHHKNYFLALSYTKDVLPKYKSVSSFYGSTFSTRKGTFTHILMLRWKRDIKNIRYNNNIRVWNHKNVNLKMPSHVIIGTESRNIL